MNVQQVREQVQVILNRQATLLESMRNARRALRSAFDLHDVAIESALEANHAALAILNLLVEEK